MKKSKDLIQSHIKQVDLIVELLDARIPISSMNPVIRLMTQDKLRLVVLNKADLADPVICGEWVAYFKKHGVKAVAVNAVDGEGAKLVVHEAKSLTYSLVQKRMAKNKCKRAINMMIVGIPNVGKSTLINTLIGRKIAKTGNKPGVTRDKQWVTVNKDFDLLDMPGILWPKKEKNTDGVYLALSGAVKDESVDLEGLAYFLIEAMGKYYPGELIKRYGIEELSADPMMNFDFIAEKRGCLLKGGRFDYDRTAKLIIQDYRKGLLGRMTFEKPCDLGSNDIA